MDALKLGLVGPWRGHAFANELLPEIPTRWYLAGYLIPESMPVEHRSDAISSDKVIDIFDAAGLKKPDISILSDEFSHVRKSVTIDWTLREAAQAQIRVLVRRILRKYGYPPDKQEKATQTVLEQAKLLCGDWAEGI